MSLLRNPDPAKLAVLRKNPAEHIPRGWYCYTRRPERDEGDMLGGDLCPFWDEDDSRPEQLCGYCHLRQEGDWQGELVGLLWDQCKACGVNEEWEKP
jgi:hypothetical protein